MKPNQPTSLEHRGYIGSVEADLDTGLLHGVVLGINDVVHYEAQTVGGLRRAFEDSVDDYLAMCEEQGTDPERPYSGKFQARVGQELHRRAACLAQSQGVSLNEVVCRALEAAVERSWADSVRPTMKVAARARSTKNSGFWRVLSPKCARGGSARAAKAKRGGSGV